MRGDNPTGRSLCAPSARTGRGLTLRRFPVSFALGGLALLPMVITQGRPGMHRALQRRLATSWDQLLVGQFWRLLTSTFVQGGPGLVGGVLVLLVLVPIAEWRIGSYLTGVAFFLGDWVSSIVVLVGARVGAALGSGTAAHVLVHRDSGTSAACYACAGAILARVAVGHTRLLLVSLLVADLAIEGVLTHMLAEIQHPVAVLVGFTVAQIARRRRRDSAVASNAGDGMTA